MQPESQNVTGFRAPHGDSKGDTMRKNKELTQEQYLAMKALYNFSAIFVNMCKGCYWFSVAFCLMIFGRVVMLVTMDLFGLY